ncbi:MAG: MBL fold metallo-hydrolase, partial [Kordiimonas sp.]
KWERMMKLTRQVFGAICSAALMPATVLAGDREDALIAKVVSAYGGDAVVAVEAITINDRYKILSIGQSASADAIDVALNNVSLTVDFANKRKSILAWNKGRGGSFLNQNIVDGETGYTFNHILKTQSENANLNYDTLGGGIMRTSDISLVKLLLQARDTAIHSGEEVYRGRQHEKLTYKMEGSPDLTIFVDAGTGLISKMTRQNPQLGELSYIFTEHRKTDGVTYASDTNFFIAGQPNIVTVSRSIEINPDLAGKFEGPTNYTAQGGNIDTSEMMAKELAEGVYFSGQNGGFSVFVDAGDHYVGSGGYPALPDRLKAVQDLAGNEKPLRDQIVTHHHSDHLGAMNEIAEMGANVVTVDEQVDTIKGQLYNPVEDSRFVRVNGKQSFGNGKVEVYDISTVHSDHYLLFYVPSAKLVFSADHFGTNLETGLPPANKNMVTFRHAVEALNLDIDGFLSAHNVRVLTMDDLRNATDGYTEASCPTGFDICAD